MKAFLTRFGASFLLALRAVARNKLRAGLTTLGIMIGVAAVVTVTALAKSARESVLAQVSALGNNALIVFPRASRSSGTRDSTMGSKLNEQDARALVRESTSIAGAAPFLRATSVVVNEGENAALSVIGTRLDYFSIRNWKVRHGEPWSPRSEAIGEKVVVIGTETARKLFGTQDPIGSSVRIGHSYYEVLGVLEEKGQSPFGQNQDEIVVMPISTMRGIIKTRPGECHAIMMSATSSETTESAQRQAELILRERHRIAEGQDDDFQVRSQAEFQALQESIFGMLTFLLVGIAAVSLVVGGIGVMNIMLVSVTERTREIGIRMAIGAREGDILVQFLVEAVVLTSLGGVAGTLVGFGAVAAFASALGWTLRPDPVTLVVALVTTTTIGLVFGFVPAYRAARLDPVKALGRE